MMNAKKIIPFEIYIDNILRKEPSKILLELFPNLSHPSQSRFHEFFKKLKELNKIQENNDKKKNHNSYKKSKKNKMELNLYKIQNGMDKRTSLMIKNIPKGIDEMNVIKWLQQLANLNYIFVPKDEFTNKILGFAFINVCNYMDILELLKRLAIEESYNKIINDNFNNNRKKIEVIYSHKQGLKSLTKSFGNSHIFKN
jgi:hypothetical protein